MSVDQVRTVMQENVGVMVSNLDKSSALEDKTEALADQAKDFHKSAKATRSHFWWKLCQERLVVAGLCATIIIIVVIVIVANAAGGGSGSDDSPSSPPPIGESSPASPPSSAISNVTMGVSPRADMGGLVTIAILVLIGSMSFLAWAALCKEDA